MPVERKQQSEGATFTPSNAYWAETHQVDNQPTLLQDVNLYDSDLALREWVQRMGAGWAEPDISAFGARVGSAEVIEWGFQANAEKPVLHTHDRRGARIDEVRFHPSYHQCMQLAMEQGLHSSHWTHTGVGANVARAAKSYLMTQIESGHGCPITMTSASIPTLRRQPDVYAAWADKILHRAYDPRNVSHEHKQSVTIGMAMTEKQGGSDVRMNSTQAFAVGQSGSGKLYELVGHKYFVSAPMCDAFLVLAQTPRGVSCFLVPRWRPDGTKNPMQIQRLKNKMGNVSNASSETELRGALGWMIGDEGHGVGTILEMVAMTRFDCVVASGALMRQAVAQITHHCHSRVAFGATLERQPLMMNVLADLILESEAALALGMRLAKALDEADSSAHEKQLLRLGTALGKYWVCKRAPGHAYEAMECIGGSGVMEDCIMPRLFRESPVNSIWEGSGNVQCLDMLRAMSRNTGSVEAYMTEVQAASGADRRLDAYVAQLGSELADLSDIEYRARGIVEKMALALQGSLLVRNGNAVVADAFCASRLTGASSGLTFGNLPRGADCAAIIARAMPRL